ncbi:MAG: pilus assembly protein PilM [Acidobacteria bacterium]|nr:pilus assembly protein PilM [Acidobacteriota bacterium]
MSLLTSWLASPLPDAAVEIAPDRVAAAAIAAHGTRGRLQACAVEALAAGAVAPALASHNIVDRAAVTESVRAVLARVGSRPARVALVIPDLAGKVSVVRFGRVPQRRDDLDQLVRWQVRKSIPFPVEEACVTYTPGRRGPDGHEFIVVAARRDVVQEYEGVCAAAGVHAGLVELATFSVLNLVLATDGAAPGPRAGDWLIVHMRPEYTSIAILRDGELIFFRNRPEDDEETLADVVHQTAMYYQDRLAGQGFARVLLGGRERTTGFADEARKDLEARLGIPVEAIDPTTAVALTDRIGESPDLPDVLAPLAGVLLRVQREAVGA